MKWRRDTWINSTWCILRMDEFSNFLVRSCSFRSFAFFLQNPLNQHNFFISLESCNRSLLLAFIFLTPTSILSDSHTCSYSTNLSNIYLMLHCRQKLFRLKKKTHTNDSSSVFEHTDLPCTHSYTGSVFPDCSHCPSFLALSITAFGTRVEPLFLLHSSHVSQNTSISRIQLLVYVHLWK